MLKFSIRPKFMTKLLAEPKVWNWYLVLDRTQCQQSILRWCGSDVFRQAVITKYLDLVSDQMMVYFTSGHINKDVNSDHVFARGIFINHQR